MKFHIPFISSLAIVCLSNALAINRNVVMPNDARLSLVMELLIPGCDPPTTEEMADAYVQRTGFSVQDFQSDLLSIAENNFVQNDIRRNAFARFCGIASDNDVMNCLLFEKEQDRETRHSFIASALASMEDVGKALSLAELFVQAAETNELRFGDQIVIGGRFGNFLRYSQATLENREKVLDFYREKAFRSTNVVTILAADILLCRNDPNFRYGTQRIQSLPGWLALTNQFPERLAANGCKYFEDAARDLESYMNDANAPESEKSGEGGSKPPSNQQPSLSLVSPSEPTDSEDSLSHAPFKQNRWFVIGFVALAAIVGGCFLGRRAG